MNKHFLLCKQDGDLFMKQQNYEQIPDVIAVISPFLFDPVIISVLNTWFTFFSISSVNDL